MLLPKHLRNPMRAGIPSWKHWPTCKDGSASQWLRHCSEDLCCNISDQDGEQSTGAKGAGTCVLTPPPNSPGYLGESPNFSAPRGPHWWNGENNQHCGALTKWALFYIAYTYYFLSSSQLRSGCCCYYHLFYRCHWGTKRLDSYFWSQSYIWNLGSNQAVQWPESMLCCVSSRTELWSSNQIKFLEVNVTCCY